MKALKWTLLLTSLWLGSLLVLAQQPEDAPPAVESDAAGDTNAPAAPPVVVVAPDADDEVNTPVAPAEGTNAAPVPGRANPRNSRPANAPATNAVTADATNDAPATVGSTETPTALTSPAAPKAEMNGEKGLRLNFRGVPLDMVLNYLSEAAGFIIVLETDVKGKVDVISQQPMGKDDAVNLLNSILNKNGYAAIRNGRTLTIVSRDEAKKRDIPVRIGANPEQIAKTDEMVTQIIPIRNANATQMTKDLQPLLPTFANLTANESGNALVLTDIQSDIRRMVEIVKAIDASISGITTIRVFPLRFADAKDLVTEIKELFPAPSGSTGGRGGNNDPRAMFMARFGGGPGGAGASTGTGQSEAKQAASRVTAVADERTNSLVVSAPDEVIEVIDKLVREIDTSAENITRIKSFHLKNADPTEMVDMLTSLFPDDTKSTSNNRSTFQFGGGRFGGGMFGGGRAQATTTSTRAQQQNRVLAVADARTSRLIVTASSELMPYIEELVAEMDDDPAKKQKVYVFNLDNANVDEVEPVLQEMFQSQNSRNSSRNSTTTNPLQQRQQNQGYGGTGTSSFGNSSSSSGRRVGQ